MIGKQIQQYQFVEKLGAGGMGEIYKAQDKRLNRMVAIKVLPSAKSGDPERRRRFLHEAQSASGLNHPSIITIHDVISDGDTEYMVMEYVSGKTLNDLIPKGGLRVPQALKYVLQMSDALVAAHSAGIIHRDLKPANIMVTDSGYVKILDFGLAKLADRSAELPDNTQTLGAPMTIEGAILGTVSYMSPEQAQGMKIDLRSDIFSFGSVLFEMLTGRRAFEGESSLSTLSSILRDETPRMADVAPDVPPQIEAVMQRCLRKSPDDRWQSMRDVQLALSALKRDSDSGSLYTSMPRAPFPMDLTETAPLIQASSGPGAGLSALPSSNIRPTGAFTSEAVKPGGLTPKTAIGIGAVVALVLGGGLGTFLLIRKHTADTAARIAAEQARQAAAQAAADQAAAAVDAAPAPPPPEPALNNDGVVDMVKGKVSADVILSQIRSAAQTEFDLSTAQIIRLTMAGVPSNVIEQMRDPKRTMPATVYANIPPKAPKLDTKNTPATPESIRAAIPTPVAAPVPIAASPSTPLVVTPAPAAAPARAVIPTVNVTLNDGVPFKIVLAADIAVDADVGKALRFTSSEDFRSQGTVVIPKGATITAEVSEAPKKKLFGFSGGKLSFKLIKAETAGGQSVNVRAIAAQRSDGPTQRPFDLGRSTPKGIAATQGTEYIGYIDGEQHLTVPQK